MSGVRGLGRTLTAAALCVALAGCTGTTDAAPTPTPTPTSPTPTPEPTELRLSVYGNAQQVAAYHQIADAYTAEHPDVAVTVRDYSDASAAAEGTRAELASGDGPDVFLLDQYELPGFVNSGHLQPLEGLLEQRGVQFGDGYQRVALTTFSANSGLQCMPMEMSPYVVYYNRALLPVDQLLTQGVAIPQAGQSWDWADFVAAARASVAEHPVGTVKGAYVPPDLDLLTGFVRSAGSDVVDSVLNPTSLTLTSDEALGVVRSVAELGHNPDVSLTPQEILDRAPLARFRRGELALYIGTRADVPALRAAKGLRFDALPLPSFGKTRAVSRVNGLCLNHDTPSASEAADFIAYAVGPEAASIAASSGAMVSARVDTLASLEFTQPDRAPRNAAPFQDGVAKSDPMPYSTAWSAVVSQAAGVLTRIYLNPKFDLDARLLTRLEKLDVASERVFAGDSVGGTGD